MIHLGYNGQHDKTTQLIYWIGIYCKSKRLWYNDHNHNGELDSMFSNTWPYAFASLQQAQETLGRILRRVQRDTNFYRLTEDARKRWLDDFEIRAMRIELLEAKPVSKGFFGETVLQ